MSPTPIVGVTSTPRLTPYLSVDMFKRDGRRGVAVDQLVPRGTPADQDAALEQYIESASAYMDSFCQQILAATVDTFVGRYNVNSDGFVVIHPRYRPVIAVTAASIGPTPAQLAPLASLTGTGVTVNYFQVPAYAGVLPVNTSQGPIQLGNPVSLPGQAWCQYTYQNGFPITQLSASVSAGTTTIQVADTTGIVAGLTYMTVYAGAKRWRFLAASVSTAPNGSVGTGPGTITTTAAAPWDINVTDPNPVMVSALPADAIQAGVLITRAFIKEAGGGNVTSTATAETQPTAGDDMTEAAGLLRPYIAPVE